MKKIVLDKTIKGKNRNIRLVIEQDAPQPAFKKSGGFCFVNWRDLKCMKLRVILFELLNWGDNRTFKIKTLEVKHQWYADQNYYFIKDKLNEFFYIVTWYKGRGKTDCILFQGTPITEGQMGYLLKTMRNGLKEKRRGEKK